MDDDFLAWQRTSEAEGANPYACRHRCLHETLDLARQADRYTLGRAMYHLAQRRGFISNRLTDSDGEDGETGIVTRATRELSAAMRAAGCEYLGDYFYRLYMEGGKIRTRYTDREEHYRREFEAICRRQRLTERQVSALDRALYFSRQPKRPSVGRCTFERSRPRCSSSHPSYEHFRMLSLLYSVRVETPGDAAPRPLNEEERAKAMPLFFRKSKEHFDFEDIAKAIAGRGNYQYAGDAPRLPYRFNFRMEQGVAGCPVSAALREIFVGPRSYRRATAPDLATGADYAAAIAERYLAERPKTPQEALADVWNVIYSFRDRDKLQEWGRQKLRLSDEDAKAFASIRPHRSFAPLSLAAIRRILPWLRSGLQYPHAVLMAKVPDVVGKEMWLQRGAEITDGLRQVLLHHSTGGLTLEACVRDYLQDNFPLAPGVTGKLYHPSMTEPYPDAQTTGSVPQLGSPLTDAVRNPMAMRSLHEIRRVVNALLREGVVTPQTEVHIEYARELNDANWRWAIAAYQKKREKERKTIREEIVRLYSDETGRNITPTEDDILRYRLRSEQNGVCLYTGRAIGIADIVGPNPRFDIEHTIPRSAGGDFTEENLTLCESRFNREVKRASLPAQLPCHADIMARLAPWRERVDGLRRQIARVRASDGMAREEKVRRLRRRHVMELELRYWRGKYGRFTMTEVPEGFARRQGAGIGLIGKYAGLYLRSLFHDRTDIRRTGVRVVKGAMTAEARKLWGVQDEYERKSRDNHTHHCIDAIVIACLQPGCHSALARFYRQRVEREAGRSGRPAFPKPWPTFTEDMKRVAAETIVVHDIRDKLLKRARRMVDTPAGKHLAQGDSARGPLHMGTFYGAIRQGGERCYVLRRRLSDLREKDIGNIVDPAVRAAVRAAVDEHGEKALNGETPVFLNREKGVEIRKVRCFAKDVKTPIHIRQQRDLSVHDYKRQYHVKNENNYLLAIYGAVDSRKRAFCLVSAFAAAARMKSSAKTREPLVPDTNDGLPLLHTLRKGQHVLLYGNTPADIRPGDKADLCRRLYVVTGLTIGSVKGKYHYGVVDLCHHQVARKKDEDRESLKPKNGGYKEGETLRPLIQMLHTQFNALVEGEDFTLSVLGEVKLKHEP